MLHANYQKFDSHAAEFQWGCMEVKVDLSDVGIHAIDPQAWTPSETC